MAGTPARKPTGKAGAALHAARTLTDQNASTADKATEATALAAQAAVTAAGGGVAGAVVGQAVRSKGGRKVLKVVAGLVVFIIVALLGLVWTAVQAATSLVMDSEDQASSDTGGAGCTPQGIANPTGAAAGLNVDQQANATAILQVVADRGLDAGDAVIAIMTAMTESSLVNVNHGDLAGPDSRGLFQQRDPWGPLEVRMDPAGATGLFLDRLTSSSLKQYEGLGEPKTLRINADGATSRGTYPPWRVAQSVQISAYPMGENYRSNYAWAVDVVTAMLGEQVIDDAHVHLWAGQLGPEDRQVDITDAQTEPGEALPVGGCTTDPPVDGPGPGAWGGHANGQIPAAALCGLSWQATRMLRCDAAAQLELLNAQFRADLGRNLSVNEAYRDLTTQEHYWTCGCTTGPAARPGTSNHGWALAIDINGTSGNGGSYEARKTTAVYQWMAANAPTFGFRENVSIREAWHWEYHGRWDG